MMRNIVGATLLAGALFIGTSVQSMPIAPTPSHEIQDENILPVRDGCGGGRHFSPALGRCVLNYYGGSAYYGGGYGYRGGVYGYRRGGYAYRGGRVYRGGGVYRGGARYHGGGGRAFHGGGVRRR
jgi:hypothetical protein